MNNIELMKGLLSVMNEDETNLSEANLPAATVMQEIEKFMKTNSSLSKDEVIKFFTDKGLSKSAVTNGVNKIERAATAAKAAGNSASGASKLMKWVKDNPTKTAVAGGAGIGAAANLAKQNDQSQDAGGASQATQQASSTQPEPQANQSATEIPPATSQGAPATPEQPAASNQQATNTQTGGLSKEEEMELHGLAFDLEKMQKQDPNIAKILEPYYKKYGKD